MDETERRLTKSWRVADAPCIEGPPERLILALAAGEAVREVRTLGRSEIRGPEADGGGFGWVAETGIGSWRAAGLSERATALEMRASWRGRRGPDM